MNTFHQEIRQAIQTQEHELAERIVNLQYARQPHIWNAYGEAGREKSVRDMKYHFLYFTEAVTAEDPSLFADYVAWVKVLFVNLNFPDEVMTGTLECTREVFHEMLPENMHPILNDYLESGLQQMTHAPTTIPSFITEETPLSDVAAQYIEALLRGQRNVASQRILRSVKEGTPIKEIYLHVFQRAQYEIGRLWMTNQVSVAQEHYCTAATQLIMSQLYPYIFATEKIGRRLIATCVGGELHEIGVRMVADFFELAGWDTYYLGANTPAFTILEALAEHHPDVLGISVTMTFHISLVKDLIARVREAGNGSPPKILVGGYPFNLHPDLWQKIGADGFASDAQGAIETANRLCDA